MQVKIEKIVSGGWGIGFAEGLTVFVALACAGDVVRVRVEQKKKKIVFASIIEIIVPSPFRIAPKCRYFGVCGGCDFQQMTYAAQLEAKEAIIRDNLKRIGKIDFQSKIQMHAAPREFQYRTRAQWNFDAQTRRIGYFKRNSHEVCDVAECPILTDALQKTLGEARENVFWEDFWQNVTEFEVASSAENVSIKRADSVQESEVLTHRVGNFSYQYDAETFFQINQELLPTFVETALSSAEGESALDLFCGVGLFTLPLTACFERVVGVEANPRSIDFAKQNARLNKLPIIGKTLEFYCADTLSWLLENFASLAKTDFILLDPPRAGADAETCELLKKIAPRLVSYVSCDSATLARDLNLLADTYEIFSIDAFDFFPQTHHIETVVRLIRR